MAQMKELFSMWPSRKIGLAITHNFQILYEAFKSEVEFGDYLIRAKMIINEVKEKQFEL